jgi:hypothetical protein
MKVFVLITLLFSICHLFGLSEQETLFFSKLDEKFSPDDDPDEWVLFVKQIGDHQFTCQFPKQPEAISNETNALAAYQAKDGDNLYLWTIEKCGKPLTIDDLLARAKNEKGTITTKTVDVKNGIALDIVFHEPKSDKATTKKRLLFCPEKKLLFTFQTTAEDAFQQFITSFEIVAPLS